MAQKAQINKETDVKILTGDIGGTKTRLALIEMEEGRYHKQFESTYPSSEFPRLADIVRLFTSTLPAMPDAAAFGLAGPVRGRRCELTNLPWIVDADQLEEQLDITRIGLLNDLEATAWGIRALQNEDFVLLQQGAPNATGNQTVIAAGTGMGQAGLYWDGRRHHPFATEGGHSDFCPKNDLEFALLAYLQRKHGQVGWEQVVSGPGLIDIYGFLLDRHNDQAQDAVTRALHTGDAAATIADLATTEQDARCTEAMQLFVSLYGTETGNLALKHMATGGVYIGGGIAPRILPWLRQPAFIQAFCNKGRMQPLLQSMRIQVITNDRTALYGPAVYLCEGCL